MNKTLAEEELDRELVDTHIVRSHGWTDKQTGKYRDFSTRAKVARKTLTFTEGSNSITFSKKSSSYNGESLEIETRKEDIVYARCSLGHDHEQSKKERVYQWFRIDYDQVEAIVEWLQLGTWSAVSKKPCKKTALLKESIELLKLAKDNNPTLSGAYQKLITKINAELPRER